MCVIIHVFLCTCTFALHACDFDVHVVYSQPLNCRYTCSHVGNGGSFAPHPNLPPCAFVQALEDKGEIPKDVKGHMVQATDALKKSLKEVLQLQKMYKDLSLTPDDDAHEYMEKVNCHEPALQEHGPCTAHKPFGAPCAPPHVLCIILFVYSSSVGALPKASRMPPSVFLLRIIFLCIFIIGTVGEYGGGPPRV